MHLFRRRKVLTERDEPIDEAVAEGFRSVDPLAAEQHLHSDGERHQPWQALCAAGGRMKPRVTPAKPKSEPSAATRMSHDTANSSPPAKQ